MIVSDCPFSFHFLLLLLPCLCPEGDLLFVLHHEEEQATLGGAPDGQQHRASRLLRCITAGGAVTGFLLPGHKYACDKLQSMHTVEAIMRGQRVVEDTLRAGCTAAAGLLS